MESRLRWEHLAALILLASSGVWAGCGPVENPDLIEWTCEDSTFEEVQQVPANVEKLRITRMSVGHLSDQLLSRFGPSLVVFTCSHCAITDLDDRTFQGLPNLQQLSLDNNELREVRANWFYGLAYLTYLDLNYNRIEHLEPEVFDMLPSIVDLRVSGNRLRCIDFVGLAKLRELKRIFISENPDFGCPNAMRKILDERGIDYEADPVWASIPVDMVSPSALPPPPSSRMPPMFFPHSSLPPTLWTTTDRPRWTTEDRTWWTTEFPPASARRPAYPSTPVEMMPALPAGGDSVHQVPPYVPTATPPSDRRPLADYREVSTSTKTVLVAGRQPTEETTTESPSGASSLFRQLALGPMLLILVAVGIC